MSLLYRIDLNDLVNGSGQGSIIAFMQRWKSLSRRVFDSRHLPNKYHHDDWFMLYKKQMQDKCTVLST